MRSRYFSLTPSRWLASVTPRCAIAMTVWVSPLATTCSSAAVLTAIVLLTSPRSRLYSSIPGVVSELINV